MSCNDLDRLQAEHPHTPSGDWPDDARQHLASCDRCARLQAFLNSAPAPEFPAELQRNIETAILSDLQPVAPLMSVQRVNIALILSGLLIIAVANSFLGLAGWHERGILQLAVDFSILVTAFGLLSNNLAHAMSPGSSRQASISLGSPYLILPLALLLLAGVLLYSYEFMPEFAVLAFSCWKIGIACAAIAAPLFWLILRRGFALNLVAESATVGLLSGLVGITVLELYCPLLERAHISAGHIGAAVTTVVTGAILGAIFGAIRRRSKD